MGSARRHVLITGGAGFVGTNLADRLLEQGRRVVVLDNLARPGVEENLRWLEATHGARVSAELADVRDPATVRAAVKSADAVFHLAAQVAVTTSLATPVADFEVNLQATVTLLEELRRLGRPVPLLFTSTNKVYGTLPDVRLVRAGERWEPEDSRLHSAGIDERRPLDFCTPYGCSKGGADQYVLDYAKTFGLPAVVFRMSCIYGPHQHGTEDQGWVAHFVISALAGEPVTVYGDGAQVRDVLYVADLVDAMLRVSEHSERLAGTAFNVGGGPANTISLLELLDLLEALGCPRPPVSFEQERAGDQRWYVTNTSRLREAVDWRPCVDVHAGIGSLHRWLLARSPARVLAAARG
ncbi:MAG: SDR family NAD(P)-dependent oxidoreductase [Actinobacteria bacterium]|nr:SDR family NAD(P)-dependent oxidoreductase [Actinomycetota bacterium]